MVSNYLLYSFFGFSTFFIPRTVALDAIVNGDKAGIDEFPYQVSLRAHNTNHYCGGGIIGDQFILTAAHCVINNENHFIGFPIHILVGTNDLLRTAEPAETVEVLKMYVPDIYRSYHFPTIDLAVLKLKRPLKLSKHIRKLELPKHKNQIYFGKTAVIAGFGLHWIDKKNNSKYGGTFDNQLRYAEVDIVDYCMAGDMKVIMPSNQICTKAKQVDKSKPRGACNGDSGGPLVHDDTVIGILSKGSKGCSEADNSSIYINISYYLDFIHYAMQNKHHEGIRTFP